MINDAFKLTIDNIFRPSEYEDPRHKFSQLKIGSSPFDNPYKVKGYSDNMNMWQRLTSLSDKSGKV